MRSRQLLLARSRAARKERGFTLIELMVVVVMVGILTVMAAPSMLEAQKNRRAFTDASQVMQLMRNAHARAVGDQAAVMVTVNYDSTSTTGDRGTLIMYEQQYTTGTTSGFEQSSMNTCKPPSVWNPTITATTAPHPVVIEGVSLDNGVDSDARVHLQLNGQLSGSAAYCFSPSGKLFVWTGTVNNDFSTVSFTGASTMAPVTLSVGRDNGSTTSTFKGLVRDVLLMPSGSVRVSSRVAS